MRNDNENEYRICLKSNLNSYTFMPMSNNTRSVLGTKEY